MKMIALFIGLALVACATVTPHRMRVDVFALDILRFIPTNITPTEAHVLITKAVMAVDPEHWHLSFIPIEVNDVARGKLRFAMDLRETNKAFHYFQPNNLPLLIGDCDQVEYIKGPDETNEQEAALILCYSKNKLIGFYATSPLAISLVSDKDYYRKWRKGVLSSKGK